LLTNVVTKVSN